MGKTLVVFLVVVSIVSSLLLIRPVGAEITSFYGRGFYGPESGVNYCSFYITITSPNAQTTYTNTMPLNFNLTWIDFPKFPFSNAPSLYGYYAYSIDEGPFVEITSFQSVTDVYYETPNSYFKINPYFSHSVNISHLKQGYHNIVINASLYHNAAPPAGHFYFNITTSPIKFLVGESNSTSPTCTPTVTPSSTVEPTVTSAPIASDFTWLLIAFIAVVFVVAILAVVLVKRQKRTNLTYFSPTP